MKRALLSAIFSSLMALRCFADAGEEGFSHLAEGPGARAAAMGGAGVSMGGDVDAAFWNPAGLAAVRGRELGLTHVSRALSVSDDSLSYAHPLRTGGVGVRLFQRRAGGIAGYDPSGGKSSDYGATDTLLAVGYARPLGRRWMGGAALKQVQESIAGVSGNALAADLGVLYSVPSWAVTFGAGVRNVGSKASFIDEQTPLPRLLDGGVSARFFSGTLVAALEAHKSSEGFFWNGGLEFWTYNLLAFRAGLDSRRDMGGGVSFGFGVRLQRVRVDYALIPQGDAFGASHRISFTYRFGGGGEAAYQEGLDLSQRGDYAGAILKFKEALDADPEHPGAARGMKEAIGSLDQERSRK